MRCLDNHLAWEIAFKTKVIVYLSSDSLVLGLVLNLRLRLPSSDFSSMAVTLHRTASKCQTLDFKTFICFQNILTCWYCGGFRDCLPSVEQLHQQEKISNNAVTTKLAAALKVQGRLNSVHYYTCSTLHSP